MINRFSCCLKVFTSMQELKGVLNSVPEIVELVGHVEAGQVMNIKENDGEEKVKAVLKSIFTQLMSASKDAVSGVVSKMRNRLNIENKVIWNYQSPILPVCDGLYPVVWMRSHKNCCKTPQLYWFLSKSACLDCPKTQPNMLELLPYLCATLAPNS